MSQISFIAELFRAPGRFEQHRLAVEQTIRILRTCSDGFLASGRKMPQTNLEWMRLFCEGTTSKKNTLLSNIEKQLAVQKAWRPYTLRMVELVYFHFDKLNDDEAAMMLALVNPDLWTANPRGSSFILHDKYARRTAETRYKDVMAVLRALSLRRYHPQLPVYLIGLYEVPDGNVWCELLCDHLVDGVSEQRCRMNMRPWSLRIIDDCALC